MSKRAVKALRSELNTAQSQNLALAEAFEHTQSELAVVSRQLDDIYYLNLNDIPSQRDYQVLPTAKKVQIIRRLRVMRQENPLAKQAMKLAMRFTFGKGVSYTIKNPESRKVVNQFWNDPENQAVLTSHDAMRERFDELLTDGEKFIVMFKADTPPYVKLGEIPMEEVTDIIYHPENRFVPVFYKRVYFQQEYDANGNNGQGEWITIGEDGRNHTKPFVRYYRDYRITDEVLAEIEGISIPDSRIEENAFVRHRLINPCWQVSGRRGISELFASREWFRVFKEFMEDRGAINAAANTFSYVRKVKGGQAAVASIKGKVGALTTGLDETDGLKRATRPVAGAFYDINEAMDVSALRADTGAVDAKEDGRMLLMTAGAGVGTMLPYFGEGGDANLATAQAMELPMVKAYEDYQTEVKNDLDAISIFVLEAHYGQTRSEAIAEQDIPEEDPDQLENVRAVVGKSNGSKPPVGAQEALPPPPPTPISSLRPPGEVDDPNQVPPIPKPNDTADDRFTINWAVPPIISQDVVKYMTAWTQLAGQIAPGNPVVKMAVIRGALNTMAVPNVEEMMDEIAAIEARLEAERAAQKLAMQQAFANSQNGDNSENGNGKGVGGAPDPLGPDLKRISNLKPPRVPATGGRLRAKQTGS